MKQVFRDWKKAVPFIMCAAVALLNIIIALFGWEIYDYGSGEIHYYYYREYAEFLVFCILPPVASAVLMMVQIASHRDDLKSRVLLAVFYFFMAGYQLFFGNYTYFRYGGGISHLIIECISTTVLPAALLAMIVLILTGKAKKWMYAAVSAAGLVFIAYYVWGHYNAMNYYDMSLDEYLYVKGIRLVNSPLVVISIYLSIILLYVVILIYKDGKVTGKLNSLKAQFLAEQKLARLLSQRNDGTISEEEYERRRSEIIRRL